MEQQVFHELAESIEIEEAGQEVFRMSQGHEGLKAKKQELEEKEKELERLCGSLKAAMQVETRAVEMLMSIG